MPRPSRIWFGRNIRSWIVTLGGERIDLSPPTGTLLSR